MKNEIDLTRKESATGYCSKSVSVKWNDGNGVEREIQIEFASGYSHGLLCVSSRKGSCDMSSIAYLTEHGEGNEVGNEKYSRKTII